VEIIDAGSGDVLMTTTLTDFQNGAHLLWDIKGKVRLRLTPLYGNAVVSAFFFDAVPVAAPAPVAPGAQFVGTNVVTKGNWTNVFGAEGSIIARDTVRATSYATVTVSDKIDYTWASPSSDVRAPLKNDLSARLASCWYSTAPSVPIAIDINITDGLAHQVAVYMFDYERHQRVATVEVVDAVTGASLDKRTNVSYLEGAYLVWNVKGRVKIKVTHIAGANATVSGIFFDKASAQF
jgi:hypothetical protein